MSWRVFVSVVMSLAAIALSLLALLTGPATWHGGDETRVYECPGGLTFSGVWDWRNERLMDGDQFVIYPPSGCKITVIEGSK